MKFSLPYTTGILEYISSLSQDNISQINDLYFSDPGLNPSARFFNNDDFVGEMWEELRKLRSDYNIKMHYVDFSNNHNLRIDNNLSLIHI